MSDEIKFANTVITVDSEVVAKITSFNRSLSVAEEDVTGAEDVVVGTNILQQQFVPISIGETAALEGISIEDAAGPDDGQSELKTAAEAGTIVVLQQVRNTGFGTALSGFFTAYEETGSISSVYKFRADFRVTSKAAVTPGS